MNSGNKFQLKIGMIKNQSLLVIPLLAIGIGPVSMYKMPLMFQQQIGMIKKPIVTGYTAASDKYFATRQRLAYHPRDKTFQPEIAASVSGAAQTQSAPPPPPPPPPPSVESPKDSSSGGGSKSKAQELEEYEKGYLERVEKAIQEEEAEAAEAEAESSQSQSKGTLPKGF